MPAAPAALGGGVVFPALALVIVSSVFSCPETLIRHEKSSVRTVKGVYGHKQVPRDERW